MSNMKLFGIGLLVIVGLVVLSIVGMVLNWTGQAVDVAKQELAPKELLRKYEWFKDGKHENI